MMYDPIKEIESTVVTRVSEEQMRGGVAAYCKERGLEPIRCNGGDYLIFSGPSGQDARQFVATRKRNTVSAADLFRNALGWIRVSIRGAAH